MSDEWESIWKEAIIAYLRYYLGICLDWLRNPLKISEYLVSEPEIRIENLPNTTSSVTILRSGLG
jgi:hypothetical protein